MTDLLGLGAAEVFVIHRLRNIDTGNVDLIIWNKRANDVVEAFCRKYNATLSTSTERSLLTEPPTLVLVAMT